MFKCDVKLDEKILVRILKTRFFVKKKEGKQFTVLFFKCIILNRQPKRVVQDCTLNIVTD
jgi:hypothetical protein